MIKIGGFGQMTPAMQQTIRGALGTARASTKKRSKGRKKKAAAKPASRKRRATKKPSRLVKGSAAAKAYMAKIRAKRK